MRRIESVAAASKDAHPRGSDIAAHPGAAAASAVAAAAGSVVSSVAASAALPDASLAAELVDVKHRITCVESGIAGIEADIAAAKKARDACPAGAESRQEHTAELQRLGKKEEQLRNKEEQLRDELKQLRDEIKRKNQALEHAGTASPG